MFLWEFHMGRHGKSVAQVCWACEEEEEHHD
jgi:hypothetical protein